MITNEVPIKRIDIPGAYIQKFYGGGTKPPPRKIP